jgi:dipeptidyl aminopeptidase/acylaminoacyl peptidase
VGFEYRERSMPSLKNALHWGWILAVLLFAGPALGQQEALSKEAYLTPPQVVMEAVLATRNENVALTNLSPDGRKFLVTKNEGLPPLERLGHSYVHLSEMIFDPVAFRARDMWVRSAVGFDLFFYGDNKTVPVQVPDHARVSNPTWSPDGSKVAFFAHFDDATYIYIADAETGYSRRLTSTPVVATLDTTFQWSKDGKKIQTLLLPDDVRHEPGKSNAIATEPKVRVARGGPHPSRTYRYLLETPADEKLLEQLITGQLAVVDIDDGKVTKIGFPNMIRSVSMSPGGGEFRISTVKKPFSYYVPLARFGTFEGIWNAEGKSVYTLAERGLVDREPQAQVAVARNPQQPQGQGRGRRGGRGGPFPGATTPPPDPAQNPVDPNQPPVDPNQPPRDPNQPPRDPDAPPGQPQPAQDPQGRRDIAWRPDGDSLSYVQLEPPKQNSKDPRQDRVMQWVPPFGKDDAKVIYSSPNPIVSVAYSDDCRTLFLTQTVDNQRQITAIDLDDKTPHVIYRGAQRGGNPATRPASRPAATPDSLIGAEPTVALDDATDDSASNDEQIAPGGFGRFASGAGAGPSLLTRISPAQAPIVGISKSGDVYLTGSDRATGANALPKPFIDKVNIRTSQKTRIFEGKGEMLETIDAVDGYDVKHVFTTQQKTDVVPNSFVTDVETGKTTQLTHNENHSPWFNKLKVERIRVARVDGFKFWVKVTTPPNRTGKLPAMFWIYPREYTDQASYDAAAGRTAATTNRFAAPTPRSMAMLCLLDYAVVEPDVPIVGPAGRMNDNYVPDLRNSLWAVIDELDKRGIIDRDRLACGGHSYGAFSTANALAHTPFFKAGIAGDGNYNRTLTSMTFQTERRDLWNARETYLDMSPLLWANQVSGALLMYHSMDDANVGTAPINADQMFMALDGLGKPAALYMYPYEDHGPVAKETILDQWARWTAWLDMYVKNPKAKG